MSPRPVLRIVLTLLSLSIPVITYRVLEAAPACPDLMPRTITCPLGHPSCSGTWQNCFGPGSILANAAWDCQMNPQGGTQCVGALVPPGTFINNPICFTQYPCYGDPILRACIPDTSAPGADTRKVINVIAFCP